MLGTKFLRSPSSLRTARACFRTCCAAQLQQEQSFAERLGGTLVVSDSQWSETVSEADRTGNLSFGFSAGAFGLRGGGKGSAPGCCPAACGLEGGSTPISADPATPAGGCLFPYYIGVAGALEDGGIIHGKLACLGGGRVWE